MEEKVEVPLRVRGLLDYLDIQSFLRSMDEGNIINSNTRSEDNHMAGTKKKRKREEAATDEEKVYTSTQSWSTADVETSVCKK